VLGAGGDAYPATAAGSTGHGHQTLTPLPQSIAHHSSMTASNSNLLGLQSGSERFLAPTHGSLVAGLGGEKTDKSTSKDYFDEDEDDQAPNNHSHSHSHNKNSNNSSSQPRYHHHQQLEGARVVVVEEDVVVEYIDRDEELSRKRRRKEDKHATLHEDVEVLMSFDDATAAITTAAAAVAVVSTYPVSLDNHAGAAVTTSSTGKGRG
jgi:hypothetical protein